MGEAMIVAAQPEATEAGAEILKRGGNAVDAAIACALVQTVVDPQMCGLAGFGSLQLYLPQRGFHGCIDFHARAPAGARPDMWADLIEGETRDGFGFVLKGRVNDVGYQSVAVPGSLLAFFEAQTEYGSMDWADVVRPAIEQAEAGFLVRPHVHFWWTQTEQHGRAPNEERLRFSESGRRVYFRPDGSLKGRGERVVNPEMARTLRRVAAGGADIFYRGEIAEEIAADFAANGGLITREDLRDYRTARSAPLRGSYRGHGIATNNPPGGGVKLLEMLNILEQFDLCAMGHNTPEYIRVVAEAMKQATADKERFVGDPAFVDVPVARLTDKGYAADVAARIRRGEKVHVERYGGVPEPADTTHVCVVDRDGGIATMTHSLGMPGGVVTPGLGFMYNGCMGVFDPRPGRAGSIAPGKGRFSAICPTIAFDGERPRLVIGAPGGAQIAIGVMQGIVNVLDFDMSMLHAVSAPRFSATSDIIDVSSRIPRFVTRELEAQGYTVARSALTYTFAAVHGIRIDGERLDGGADPGHDGMALAV